MGNRSSKESGSSCVCLVWKGSATISKRAQFLQGTVTRSSSGHKTEGQGADSNTMWWSHDMQKCQSTWQWNTNPPWMLQDNDHSRSTAPGQTHAEVLAVLAACQHRSWFRSCAKASFSPCLPWLCCYRRVLLSIQQGTLLDWWYLSFPSHSAGQHYKLAQPQGW